MAGQHRAGQVVEARLAGLAQPALARRPVVVPAVADHVTRRAPHTVRPALPADQVEALGIIEKTGQADQVGCHETFRQSAGAFPNQPIMPAFLTSPAAWAALIRTTDPSP